MTKIYKTDNMAIAAYLDVNGLRYLGSDTGEGRSKKRVVFFKFEDEKEIALDLERAYRNSSEKNYRDAMMFFRNEVYKAIDNKE